MIKPLYLLLALSQFLTLAVSASIRIQIPASHLLPNPNTLPASTHATLTSGTGPQLKAILRKGNYLEFTDIPTTGSHLLDIYSRDYVFAPYRIDISPQTSEITAAFETYRGTRWADHGVDLVALSSSSSSATAEPLTISAKVLSRRDFYEQRQGFNVASLLKNPMMLMGVVALALAFGMPKLMENMDPEMKAEYDEMQKKGPMAGITRAMQGGGGGGGGGQATTRGGGGGGSGLENFDLAGFLAGSQTKSSSAAAAPAGGAGGGNGEVRERKR